MAIVATVVGSATASDEGRAGRPHAVAGVMDLFDADGPRTLVADAEGGIRLWPSLVAPDLAAEWFDALRHAPWRSHRRTMYDRVVDVPRLLAAYGAGAWPADLPLAAIRDRVQAVAPAPYDTVGLNLYRDGHDSVAMHNDKLHTLAPGMPIALVSLGDTRVLRIKARGGGRRVDVPLAAGSLLVMSHASQTTHEHGIPKTAHPVGARMSVVFRVRPRGAIGLGVSVTGSTGESPAPSA